MLRPTLFAAIGGLSFAQQAAAQADDPGAPLVDISGPEQAGTDEAGRDIVLDVPQLNVEELDLEVETLDAKLSLEARLGQLFELSAGADVTLDQVKLKLSGVEAQATFVVRLDEVRATIDRILRTLDEHPQVVEQLNAAPGNSAPASSAPAP